MRRGVGILLGGAFLAAGSIATASAEPLKIALIEAMSGPAAADGKLYYGLAKYAIDKINADGGFNSEPVQLLSLDNGGNSSQASDKFTEAAEQGAQIIVQGGSSAIAAVLSEDVRKYDLRHPDKPIIYLNVGAEALELTGAKCNFYSFRLAATASMRMDALLETMKEQGTLGKRVYAINEDYSYGRDGDAAIYAGASKFGYEVVGSDLHGFGRVQDFAPYVAKMRASNATTVLTTDWATDLLLLAKAISEGGLKASIGSTYLDYPGTIGSLGDRAVGEYVANTYNAELEKPELVEDYKAKVGHYPLYHSELHTVSMFMFLENALRKVSKKDAAVDVKALAYQLENTSVQDGMGVTSMRKGDHQAIIPIIVSRVQAGVKYPADGTKYGFSPVKVIPGAEVIYAPQASCTMVRP